MRRAILGRLPDVIAIVALVVLSVAVTTYILLEQGVRLPVVERGPVYMWAEFTNARGVNPGQGQTVRVSGMRVGDIGAVELENGLARVRMDLDPEYSDLVRADATALLRPRTGLKDMFLELDPGSNSERALKENSLISVENTAPDINPDEILSALDSDTRAYLRLLLTGAGKGLQERGGDLREVFRRLGPLFRDIRRLNGQVALRRENLTRLISNTNQSATELATRDDELATLVHESNRVFRAIGSQEQGVSSAVRQLPATLGQAKQTLLRVNELGQKLPALDSLQPVVRELDRTNPVVEQFARDGEPILREDVRPLVRAAVPYVDVVRPAARDLGRAGPDLRASFEELNRFFNIAANNPGGAEGPGSGTARDEGYLFWLGWVAQNGVSVFSTGDAQGPYRRFISSASCATLDALVNSSPSPDLASALLGVTDLLNDPGLCPD